MRGGVEPKVGAVMSFRPYHAMTLGHVAMVSKVIDRRTVLLRHANWSPIDGRRGQIEMDVRAVDVSPNNDWSEVRVWYAPIGDLGTTHWPVNGFIYNHKPKQGEDPFLSPAPTSFRPPMQLASAEAPARDEPGVGENGRRAGWIGANQPDRWRFPERDQARGGHGDAARGCARGCAQSTHDAECAGGEFSVARGPATLNPALRNDPIGRIIAQRMGTQED